MHLCIYVESEFVLHDFHCAHKHLSQLQIIFVMILYMYINELSLSVLGNFK